MGAPLNTAYFTNLTAQINAASSCAEVQALATIAVDSLNDLTASITAQAAIIAPELALLTVPTNPTAVVTWVSNFITDYLTPQLASYTAYVAQLNALAIEAPAIIAAISAAAASIGSCSITIPTFSPGSVPSPPSPPVYPPFASGITVTDGVTALTDVEEFFFTGATVTSGGTGIADISITGGGGAGTVTSVGISTPGAGVVVGGGPITSSGTLTVDLSSSAYAALALAATALQSISIATGTGLTGGPLGASGSTVALANTAVTAGSYTYASLTVDAQGRITAAASGTAPPAAANPTATVSGSAVNGSAATFMRSDAAPALANTAVTAGSYTTANITVDAQGRITAASSGSAAIGVPGTIPDLTLWWESDNILGASGAIINKLQDRTPWLGGGGVVAGNSTGTVAIDSTLLNSLPVLKWPNSQAPGTYTLPITLPVLVPGATIFIVAKGVTATGTQAIIGGAASGALALYLVGTSGTAKIALAKTQVAVFTPSTTAWTPGAWFQANATFVSASGAYAYRQARATAGSGTSATTGISAPTGIIGSDGGASPLNASLAVLIVYNRVLTSTEITNVENYINAKWGV